MIVYVFLHVFILGDGVGIKNSTAGCQAGTSANHVDYLGKMAGWQTAFALSVAGRMPRGLLLGLLPLLSLTTGHANTNAHGLL